MPPVSHELAPQHLPPFIVPPGSSDILFIVVLCALLLIVLVLGNFYFKLHALPEGMAKHANSTQLHLIGVLALIALFTHNNIFWILALLVAAVELPDFTGPLNSIARSLRALAVGANISPDAVAEENVAATHSHPTEEPQ